MDRVRAQRWLLVPIILALCGCSGEPVKAPIGERSERSSINPGTHKIRAGESLYSIAWRYGLDHRTLARWNGIGPPYTIYVGQHLRLTEAPPVVGTPPVTPPARGAAPSTRKIPVPRPARAPTSVPAQPQAPKKQGKKPVQAAGPPVWRWPAEGPIVRPFSARGTGKKGIAIGGGRNTPVRAAADGDVVYRGSGLVGYGALIILKHNNNYLSAYGHNQRLLVQEGDRVNAGQVIARMGSSGTNQVMLHFEVRRSGKPVDPLRYLPRR